MPFREAPATFGFVAVQHFLEKSAYVAESDAIDFSSKFQKHPYGYQVTKNNHQNDRKIAKKVTNMATKSSKMVTNRVATKFGR
ncbi:hypothetical protein TNCV_4710771 [Trichonephila clavipes]|uniref:Uncharacterized protein n=1 Tax=Trichonephila clavipes TaxID=2585209 RepID=A0A8X6VBP9_TRICX|nr:hypothetical protein TNCV_4710771 [Trichonephila clavipes]